MPVDYSRISITGEFPRYYITSGAEHAGMDFAAPLGTPIYASADGTVNRATMGYPDQGEGVDDPAGWANTLIIEHNLPNQPRMQTIYAHLQNRPVVTTNQEVKKGQLIGYMGSSGASTGSHLHYQVEVEGSALNPLHLGKFNRFPPQNPRNYLGDIEGNLNSEQEEVYCDFEGKGNTEFGGYPPISKEKSQQILADYINQNLGTKTTLKETLDNKPKTLQQILDSKQPNQTNSEIIKQTLQIQTTQCGIYYYPLDTFYNKDNSYSGYRGGIYINPYDQKAYTIKNGIHEKYVNSSGTCGIIGVANTEEKESNIPPDSTATTAYWQGFIRGENFSNNRIFWYQYKEDCGWFCNKTGDRTQFVVSQVANEFENNNNVWNYGYPKQDTQEVEGRWCKQGCEFKGVDVCKKGIGIEETIIVKGGNPTDGCKTETCKFNFKLISGNIEKYEGGKVWIIAHGRGDNPDGWATEIANTIKKENPDDNILLLDWREIATDGKNPPKNGSSWARPMAREIKDKLNLWGFHNPSDLNLIGHSLGTIQVSQISREFGGARLGMLFSPPGPEYLSQGEGMYRYPVDGNKNDFITSFQGLFQFSRSFVVINTVADNPLLALTADERILIDSPEMGGGAAEEATRRHNSSPKIFLQLIENRKLANNLFDLNNRTNNNLQTSPNFGYNKDFHGRIQNYKSSAELNFLMTREGDYFKVIGTNKDDTYKYFDQSITKNQINFQGAAGSDILSYTNLIGNQYLNFTDFSNQDKIQLNRSVNYVDHFVEKSGDKTRLYMIYNNDGKKRNMGEIGSGVGFEELEKALNDFKVAGTKNQSIFISN
jgi:pimeloyl-ACP methyl ester carboxylesterase